MDLIPIDCNAAELLGPSPLRDATVAVFLGIFVSGGLRGVLDTTGHFSSPDAIDFNHDGQRSC
jgi:hypothetical protein